MRIEHCKYWELDVEGERETLISLLVRGDEEAREDFINDIQDIFSLNHHEEHSSIAGTEMWFNKNKDEGINLRSIKKYTLDWIEEYNESKKNPK